ncbi:MAG: OmpA family protein [Bacteroidetes bacterium]|nr:OmpA family protein [Bacteroidota bacterium]
MPLLFRQHVIAVITLLVSIVFLGITPTIAQTKYGITGGVGKASLYNFAVPPADNDSYSGTTAYWFGINMIKPLAPNNIDLYLAGLFNAKGYKYYRENTTGANNTAKDSGFDQSIKYIDVQLGLRKKFVFGEDEEHPNSFFVGTGPVASFLAGGKETWKINYFGSSMSPVNNTNTKLATGSGAGQYKPMFFSWNIGAGFEFSKLSLWLSFNIPLTDYFQDANQSISHKVKTFGINVSYAAFTHVKKDKPVKKEKPVKTITPPTVAVDSLKDTDGDSIPDYRDQCPGVKGSPKYNGCPVPDTDGDGIDDDHDKCPFVPGTAANNGCPPPLDTVKANTKDSTYFTIYFEPGKHILRSEAYETLTQVVQMMKANPKLKVIVRGHTDNVGSEEANNNRSLLRASVCADYITSFYIDKSRIKVEYYGNKKPAADLNDPLLQWKNRRVEICVYESQ